MVKKPNLDAAYALQSPSENRLLYAEWAESYDHDFAKNMGYAYLFVWRMLLQKT